MQQQELHKKCVYEKDILLKITFTSLPLLLFQEKEWKELDLNAAADEDDDDDEPSLLFFLPVSSLVENFDVFIQQTDTYPVILLHIQT